MHLLNLTLGQFLAVFGSIAALTIALYLLDRSRRRQVVSSLRFWVAAEQPPVITRRRKIQQPWSLLLQLLSIALLLLAIAQLRFGAPCRRAARPRAHPGHFGVDGRLGDGADHPDGRGATARPAVHSRGCRRATA